MTLKLLYNHHLSGTIFLILLIIGCSTEPAKKEKSVLWGGLEKGQYDVGFTTSFHFDKTRSAVPYTDWQQNIYPTRETEGRQMQLNIWYPAIQSNKSPLTYDHYIMLMGKQTDFTIADSAALRFGQQQFINQTNALGGNGNFNLEKLKDLGVLETAARQNITTADGEFPLVVFPNGSSPAFQSIICEYLASHGFVAAAMAPKGFDGFANEASAKGIQVAVRDMEFALDRLLELSYVDKNQIGLIGNAITSSQITALQTRSDRIKCLVSLEGGLLSAFEQRLLRQNLFYEPQAVDVPILAIYAPHPSIDPIHIAHLKYADRYFIHFPEMKEFHFLNFGAFEQFVPEIIGPIDSTVQESFEMGILAIRLFLESQLKNEPGFEAFHQNLATEFSQLVDTTFFEPALPAPPSLTQLKNGYTLHGFSYIDSTYHALKVGGDEQPFPVTYYSDMKDWLSWNGDDTYSDRFLLYELAQDSYPDNAEVHFYLGYFALETGRPDRVRKHYARARKLLDENTDEEITLARKARMLRYISEDLQNIGAN